MDKLPTAKDSINTRYCGPARLVLNDPVAARYIGLARTLLGDVRNRLALGGIEQGARKITLADGTKIVVLYDGCTNIIRIDVPHSDTTKTTRTLYIFLESAWVNIGDVYPLYAEYKPPGRVYYSATVLEWYRHDTLLLTTAKCALVPWLDKITIATDSDMDFNIATFEVRNYTPGMDSMAFPANAFNKRLIYLIGALKNAGCCTQTGKAKLFFQTQMGRNNDGGIGLLSEHATSEPSMWNTKGIYTAKDHSYYLLTVSLPTLANEIAISATKITFKPETEWLISYISNESIPTDIRNKIEAYLFSTAESINEADDLPVKYDRFVILGTPMYYGWKSNWNGDKWSIVTNEKKWDDDNVFILYHIARRYSISISEIVDSKDKLVSLAAEIVLDEEGIWTPRVGTDVIWYPDTTVNAMAPFVPIPDAFRDYPGGYRESDVPVYCFYDKDDKLTVIRHSLKIEPARYYYPPYGYPNAELYGVCAPLEIAIDELSHNGGWKGGFYCEVHDTRKVTYNGTVTQYDLLSSFPHGNIETMCQPRLPLNGCTIQEESSEYSAALTALYRHNGEPPCLSDMSIRYVERSGISMRDESQPNQVRKAVSAMAIPFLDCEAVYLGASEESAVAYFIYAQTGSVNVTIQHINEPYVFRHALFWRKSDTWGEGTIVDTNVNATGKKYTRDIEIALVSKHNYVPDLNKVAFRGRSGVDNIVNDRLGTTFYPTEQALNTAIDETLGYLRDFFSPTLFGPEKHYWTYICAVEGVAGDLYYTNDVTTYSEAHIPDSLPDKQYYGGLFTGWN